MTFRKERKLESWLSVSEITLLLQGTWVQFPAPAWQLTAIRNSSSWGSNAPSDTHMVHVHTRPQTAQST